MRFTIFSVGHYSTTREYGKISLKICFRTMITLDLNIYKSAKSLVSTSPLLDLLGNVLLAGALDDDVVVVAGVVLAADGLPEVIRQIGFRPVDDKWVEEHCVSFIHVEMNFKTKKMLCKIG